jgi:hypothetical protein
MEAHITMRCQENPSVILEITPGSRQISPRPPAPDGVDFLFDSHHGTGHDVDFPLNPVGAKPLFTATVQAREEALINAPFAATEVTVPGGFTATKLFADTIVALKNDNPMTSEVS